MSNLSLASHKRILTRYTNQLQKVLTRFKDAQLEEISVQNLQDEITPTVIQTSLQQLEEAVAALENMTTKIQHALDELATMFEKSHPTSPNIEEEFAQCSTTAEEAIGNTFEYLVLLHARIHGFKAHAELLNTSHKHSTTNSSKNESTVTAVVKNLELPTNPIPTFNGDIWDWDNFWELFNLNVHSQNLSELQKFNYLLNSLKGETLQSMKKFQLTRQNYLKAIEFLTNKYGNPEELIRQLLRKMDKISLHSSSIHEQRRLLEDIEAIIGQLVQKGENVDNQSMYQKVLSKFPVGIQRKVIHKKITSPDEPFTMQQLLKYFEVVITSEEQVCRQTSATPPRDTVSFDNKGKHWKPPTTRLLCMYCKGDHKPFYCSKYETPQRRYLQNNKLCNICASPSHSTIQCNGSLCRKCQKRHHTACCLFPTPNEKTFVPSTKNANAKNEANASKHKEKELKKPTSTSKINHVGQETPAKDKSFTKSSTKLQSTFLPTGELTIMNPTTKQLEKVSVLLDTGAELSFIDENLAQKLGLPKIEEIKLRLNTFGSCNVQERVSRKVPLQVIYVQDN
ncbi:unnamed protein product [Angiostrongylus costaricensis]|uniref:DUF1758 domain-containing protein n=2 Tax=Angiostrongylus costaricensis TaxID=334426 RepID=A0A0R3Q2P4_ANGCS|nr:unnamed protein product [Angiostrongylus costaricensis]